MKLQQRTLEQGLALQIMTQGSRQACTVGAEVLLSLVPELVRLKVAQVCLLRSSYTLRTPGFSYQFWESLDSRSKGGLDVYMDNRNINTKNSFRRDMKPHASSLKSICDY